MSLNATSLFIQATQLPATFKGSPNEMFVEMIKRMRILSPSGTNFIYIGDTAPTSNVGPWLKNGTQWWVWDPSTKVYAPVDITESFTPAFVMGRSRPTTTDPPVWLQTTQDATSDNPTFFGEMIRWFVYDGVNWLSPHPVPPNCPECRIWTGTEQALWSYDGGDGSDPSSVAPTAYTGAMWLVETAFQFRFPVGVGTAPAGFDGNIASSVAPLERGGDERVVLTEDNMVAHRHPLIANVNGSDPLTGSNYIDFNGTNYTLNGTDTDATLGLSGLSDGNSKSHQNMPPYVGVYFIKRSTRIYYTP